jgi:hypothetical protein
MDRSLGEQLLPRTRLLIRARTEAQPAKPLWTVLVLPTRFCRTCGQGSSDMAQFIRFHLKQLHAALSACSLLVPLSALFLRLATCLLAALSECLYELPLLNSAAAAVLVASLFHAQITRKSTLLSSQSFWHYYHVFQHPQLTLVLHVLFSVYPVTSCTDTRAPGID